MNELIFVKVTEVDPFNGDVIREETRKFENRKKRMFYVLGFIAKHDAKVFRYLSDGIVLRYYDTNNELIEAIITEYRVKGSE